MKSPKAPDRVLFPAFISISAETAYLLKLMANDLGISLDELISSIAEDSVCGLQSKELFSGVSIPDSFNREQLQNHLCND